MKPEEALSRAMALCSRSEKAVSDINSALERWGIENEREREEIIARLIADRFIDEERYSSGFALDRFRFARWGRIKIRAALRARGIPEQLIEKALGGIDSDEYRNLIRDELTRKRRSVKAVNQWDLKGKLMRFGASRGYEQGILLEIIDELTGE